MKYHVDYTKNIPAYLQLYHQLRQDIVNGAFAYGSRLPSKRLLAEETCWTSTQKLFLPTCAK